MVNIKLEVVKKKMFSSISKATFQLHLSFTLDDSTLSSVSEFLKKNDVGIHIHLCEDESDKNISLKKYGKLPVQRLLDFNLAE